METNVLDQLRELRAQGGLEAAYDSVAALLGRAEIEDDAVALRRVGRLLAGVDPRRVLARHPATPVVTVAITGQSTVAPVVDPLTAELARHGILLRPVLGDHGAYVHDLTDPAGRFAGAGHDLALCLLDAETVLARVPEVWRPEDVERAADEALRLLADVAAAHTALSGGTLVLNTVPLPRSWSHQLVDHRSRAELGAVWRDFNSRLLRMSATAPGLVVIDLDPLVAEGGPVHDLRLAHYAGARLGTPLLAAYAREAAHLARSLRGATRKCLVLDLDHTLWDGVLAEDGPDGVAAAGTDRGEAFGAFQRVVKQLASQGVLLAVSSKNDRAEAVATLRDHPDMRLRDGDFVRIDADWEPKDGHLLDIAGHLGLGTDALVFVDDSAAECARVRRAVPEAAVVRLDDEPAAHVSRLLRDGWFDRVSLTEDDRDRNRRYRAEAGRRELRLRTGAAEDFLRDLGIEVEVGPPHRHEQARFAQLTQRTNRFNLAGRRMTEAEVSAAASGHDGELLLVVRSADRFGDSGLVGALLARRTGDALDVENVWLSCRVLARGIEQALLGHALELARASGCTEVRARYVPTPKNGRAADFYPSMGFAEVSRRSGETLFAHDLIMIPAMPAHLRTRSNPAGGGAA
ncbi:HAD-IIIC family phosphatase [Streptomyces vietnamensis]|uniref:HAD-IIIC family phosphatase n=1 Tax=Streptomyces vietnamensis TaxID=362257 RepID=UPI00342DF109